MRQPTRVLELRSVRGTGGGPEKTILLGAASADPERVAVTVCYLRDGRDRVFSMAERARDAGVDYVELRERHSFDPAIWGRLTKLVYERRIEIVHAHDYKTDLLAWLLAWRTGVSALSTAHGWTGHSARERRVYYPMDKRLLARFPRVIAVSSQVRDDLLRHGAAERRVRVILNGIDAARFRRDPARVPDARARFGFDAGDVVIAGVGRLAPQKRFDLLIDAVGLLVHKRPALRLVIAGEGAERGALQARIDRLGLDGTVRLIGNQPDVTGLHHAADLFVQSADYEGTPNAVLEAMAFEVPVVATDAGGTRELVRDGVDGVIVPRGDAARLAQAVSAVLDDPAAAARRARCARRRVETDLSFAARMTRVEGVYAEVLKYRS